MLGINATRIDVVELGIGPAKEMMEMMMSFLSPRYVQLKTRAMVPSHFGGKVASEQFQ